MASNTNNLTVGDDGQLYDEHGHRRAPGYPQLIPFNRDQALAAQRKGVEQKWCQKSAAETFKLNARAFQKIMSELPEFSPLDVMRLAIHVALEKEDFEAAARYANQLAEYSSPKLARIESNVTTRTADLSDEELQAIIAKEGLE